MNKLFLKENERYVYGSRSLESHKEKLMPLCDAQKRSRQIHSIQVEKHKQRQNSKSSVSTIFTRIVRQVALFILPFSLLAISHILFFPIYFNFSHPTKTILSTFLFFISFIPFLHEFLHLLHHHRQTVIFHSVLSSWEPKKWLVIFITLFALFFSLFFVFFFAVLRHCGFSSNRK